MGAACGRAVRGLRGHRLQRPSGVPGAAMERSGGLWTQKGEDGVAGSQPAGWGFWLGLVSLVKWFAVVPSHPVP